MRDRVCRAVEKVDDEIRASALPALPLMWTEWNVPSFGLLWARDNWYVGPALARDISQCDGKVNMMSFWTFDDVFEEDGVAKTPFDGAFGLIALDRIKKPSFYDFSLLHKLGEERLANPADNLLVTRRKDGALIVAAWNLVDMDKLAQGAPLTMRLTFKGVAADAAVTIQRVDATQGNPMTAYRAMGSPRYPTPAQVAALNRASSLPAPERSRLTNGVLELTLPVNGLAVIEIPAATDSIGFLELTSERLRHLPTSANVYSSIMTRCGNGSEAKSWLELALINGGFLNFRSVALGAGGPA